jgi:hypothetical protein
LPPKHLRPFCGIVCRKDDGLSDWGTQPQWRHATLWARLRRRIDPQRGR